MPRRHRDCHGKHPHPDRAAALAALATLVRNRYAFHDTMRVYRCPHCNAWHVGHRRGVNGSRRK